MADIALKEYLDRRLDDLHRYMDRRFTDQDRRNDEQFTAAKVALDKAEQALREYKSGSNEWRDALKDANGRMATRLELDKLDDSVRELQRAKANFDGRLIVITGGMSVGVSLVLWALTRIVK
jgi:hypothetical protein